MGSTTERLSVLETKVDDLASGFTSLENKVDVLIRLVDKGNFDTRISDLESKSTGIGRFLLPILYTVIGAVVTFLVIDFIKSPAL